MPATQADWVCNVCQNSNRFWREYCNHCNTFWSDSLSSKQSDARLHRAIVEPTVFVLTAFDCHMRVRRIRTPISRRQGRAFDFCCVRAWAALGASTEEGTGPKADQIADGLCLCCRQKGHTMHECPKNVKAMGKHAAACFNCGDRSHSLRDCPKPKQGNGAQFAACFVCNEIGHLSSKCPKNANGVYPKGGSCFNCRSIHHLSKDCPTRPAWKPKW